MKKTKAYLRNKREKSPPLAEHHDMASGNLTLKDILKLYVYARKPGKKTYESLDDLLKDVSDEAATSLFLAPERMSDSAQKFLLFMMEIAYLETGMTPILFSPTQVASKHLLKVAKIKSSEEWHKRMMDLILKFLQEMEDYFEKWLHVYSMAKASEALAQKVETYADASIKVLEKYQRKSFVDWHKLRGSLWLQRTIAQDHVKEITARRLPNAARLTKIKKSIADTNVEIQRIAILFRKMLRFFTFKQMKKEMNLESEMYIQSLVSELQAPEPTTNLEDFAPPPGFEGDFGQYIPPESDAPQGFQGKKRKWKKRKRKKPYRASGKNKEEEQQKNPRPRVDFENA